MGKASKRHYVCSNCGSTSPKWVGQCVDCSSWGTVQEEFVSPNTQKHNAAIISGNILDLDDLSAHIHEDYKHLPTGINELDRILGGGLVMGGVVLIGGEPGIGKSTLLLQLAGTLNNLKLDALYVTAEESVAQIKLRAKRLKIDSTSVKLLSSNSVEDVLATLDKNPDIGVLIVDSIQTVQTSQIDSTPGTVSQVKSSAHLLISYAKRKNIVLIIVGHVTKDGQLAGPKLLEHMVDTVLYFESDPQYHFRILRSMKNRFGSVNEIGVFEMTPFGLAEIISPSEIFLSNRACHVSGTSIFAGIEGARPILVEIQALLAPSNMAIPRRSVIGWDSNRLSMILAVLAVRSKLNLMNYEVYLTVTGGLKITEPAADLAVAAALVSAAANKPINHDTIFFGEISLSGEVRKSAHIEARIKEAEKLGFATIICRSDQAAKYASIKNIEHISELQNIL